jgi:ribosomal protein L7/L12
VGQLLISLLSDADKAEIDAVVAHGRFVYAVRRVREMTGLSLIDAKRLVESLRH